MTDVAEQLQAAKRKFQRVNQEIVKQNVSLHDQLAKTKQEHHLVMQENIRLKGKIVALESKLAESENVLIETKVRIRSLCNVKCASSCPLEIYRRADGYAGGRRKPLD